MSGTVRIKTGTGVNYIANSSREDVVEVPREEWDAMDAGEQEAYLESIAEETLANAVNAWAYVGE